MPADLCWNMASRATTSYPAAIARRLRVLLGAIRAVARGHLDETRARIGSVDTAIAPAFLPLALV